MKQWFTLWCCLFTLTASAQREGQQWYFGNNAAISFASGQPVAAPVGARVGYEAAATATDPAGNLLFYTNSVDIWNAQHQLMENGLNIGGHESASQGAVIVRHPGNSSQYYLFVLDGCDNLLKGGLKYVIVDVAAQAGLGEVVSRDNQLSKVPLAEKVTAVRHANGRDTWILVHGWESNAFYAYLLSASGIDREPVVTAVGSIHKGGSGYYANANAVGYMKASPDGSKLVVARRDSNLELFDFDNATGQLSHAIALPQFYRHYGVAFSPDGSQLYTSTLDGKHIYQFDLRGKTAAAITASATSVASSWAYMGALQLAPDGKIYVALYNSHFLGAIEKPNVSGVGCSYQNEAVSLGNGLCQLGLPNFPNAFPANEWTGAVSTKYAVATNWSKKVVPGAADDVIIRAGAGRMPVLSTTAAAHDFTVEAGARMTDNGKLAVLGNLVNESVFDGSGSLLIEEAGQHRLGGQPLTIGSLEVGNQAAAQLTGPVRVQRLLTLNGNLTTNGYPFTLLADAQGTAMVVNGAGAVSGAVTVQHFREPSMSGVLHVASPVERPGLAPLAINGATAWRNPTGALSAPLASSREVADPLLPGLGYLLKPAAPTLSFVGELHNGDYAVASLTRSSAPESGWWLLGNPYPAPILWDKLLPGAVGLDGAVYVFQPDGPFAGAYASFVRGVSVNGGTNRLPLGQAFFVHTTRAGTTGSLRFVNAARQTTVAPPTEAGEKRPLLQLQLQSRAAATQVAVYFEPGATAAFDTAFDAYRGSSPAGLLLSVPAAPGGLAIQGLPPLTKSMTVPLRVQVPEPGRYVLRATQLLNLPATAGAILVDAETGRQIDLRQQPAYSFRATANRLSTFRFSLHFTVSPAVASATGKPAPGQDWLHLPASIARKAVGVRLYNSLLNQTVRKSTLSPLATAAMELSLAGLIQGFYVVQMLTTLGKMNRRQMLRQA